MISFIKLVGWHQLCSCYAPIMHNVMNIPLKYTSYGYDYLFDLTHESILYNKNCLYQLQPRHAVA